MSILIEDMEMPTACFACKLLNETYWACRVHGDANHSADRRPTDCPLVEVPPHGRLIDADVMKTKMVCSEYWEKVLIEWIDEQKTVIPAEEG